MSAIRKSLIKLEYAVDKLQASASSIEGALAGQQRDMFSTPPASVSNDDGIDGAIVVKALDQTIQRVEKLLAEA